MLFERIGRQIERIERCGRPQIGRRARIEENVAPACHTLACSRVINLRIEGAWAE